MILLQTILFLYLFVINIIGLAVMGIDKHRAKTNSWRIPEKTLFFISIIGGSLGTYVGMELFRHKTKHKKFTLGMPAILLAHGILLISLGRIYF